MEANHTAGGGATINVPAGIYVLTIPNSGAPNETFNETIGDLDIIVSMSIVGAGASVTIIDGNGSVTNDRVIQIGAKAGL